MKVILAKLYFLELGTVLIFFFVTFVYRGLQTSEKEIFKKCY
jgi:hypothetical protein